MQPSGPKSRWIYQANSIVAMGYPAVEGHLPDLLVWLQDRNWPGAPIIEGLLIQIGAPLIPHVRDVLRSQDRVWQYWVLNGLVAEWPRELVTELEPDLMRLIRIDDQEGVDLEAMKLLSKHHPGDGELVRRAALHKRQNCEFILQDLDEIEGYLRSRA